MTNCSHCNGELRTTFKTLDLTEYQCQDCGKLYTVSQGSITEWPAGSTPTNIDDILEMMANDTVECQRWYSKARLPLVVLVVIVTKFRVTNG